MASFRGKRTLNDCYLVFATLDDCKKYIAHAAHPLCKIYAKDYINYSGSKEQTSVGSNRRNNLSIITNTTYEIENDFVLLDLKTYQKWRVISIMVDDDNQNKALCAKPQQNVILHLKR